MQSAAPQPEASQSLSSFAPLDELCKDIYINKDDHLTVNVIVLFNQTL